MPADMGCGLPCVSYDTPTGPSDIITDGVNGKIVPYMDEDRFVSETLQLIENPGLLKEFGKAAEFDSHIFDEDHVIPMWLDFFKQFGY